MFQYVPDYEHLRCSCGGIIGLYNRADVECDRCGAVFDICKLDYDSFFINEKTGWMFPVKNKEVCYEMSSYM